MAKKYSWLFFGLLLLVGALVFWGCGSGVAPNSTLSFQSVTAGQVFFSPDQRFRVLIPQGSLPPGITPEVVEQPSLPGFVGKTYSILPQGLILTGPIMVQIRKDAVQLRSDTLAITMEGPVPLKTRLEGEFYSAELVYLTRIGLSTSSPVADAAEARQRFLQQYLPSLDVLGTAQVEPGEDLRFPYPQTLAAFGPFTLEPGRRLQSSVRLYGVNSDASGQLIATLTGRPELTIDRLTDFFWVDLLEGGLNQHPCLYVLLDRETGQFRELVSGDHPLIDGQDILATAEEKAQSPQRLTGAPLQVLPRAESAPRPRADQAGGNCKRLALILSVTGEAYHRAALNSIQDGLTRVEFDGRRYERVLSDNGQFSKLITEVLADQTRDCLCDGLDEVFVFITGHGSVPNPTTFDFTFPFYHPGNNPEPGAGLDFKNAEGKSVGAGILPLEALIDELNKLCLSRQGRVKLVVEACFAKELHDLMNRARQRAETDVQAGRPITAADKKKLCFRGDIVVTSGRSSGYTFSDAGLYAGVLGGKLEATGGLIDLKKSFDRTVKETTFNPRSNILLGLQKPAFLPFERVASVGNTSIDCPCDCPPLAGLGFSDDESREVAFVHEVGVSPCPQPLNKLTIVNDGTEPADIMAISSNPTIVVTPATVLNVRPGGTAAFNVTYECTEGATSFESVIEFVAVSPISGRLARLNVPVKATIVRPGTPSPTPTQTPSPTTTPSPTVSPTPGPGGCARVVFRNQSTSSIQIQFTAASPIINGGNPITLAPGQTFQGDTAEPIDNLDLIYITGSGPVAQGFEFDVPCGQQQVFIQSQFSLQFDQEPIP